MKRLLPFLLLIPLLQACPPVKTSNKVAKELKNNHMNFAKTKKIHFENLSISVSEHFEKNQTYFSYLRHSEKAVIYQIYAINALLLLEKFSPQEIENIKYYHPASSTLQSIHEAYVTSRTAQNSGSTESYRASKAKKLHWKYPNFSSVIQRNFIRENQWDEDNSPTVAVTSFRKGNDYYVIQFSVKRDKMVYLYDDYLRMLKSIQ